MKQIIQGNTMLIVPNNEGSNIINEDGVIKTFKNTIKIVKNSCLYYGSTLDGRVGAAKKTLGYSYKIPLVISESQNLIIFPTSSTRNNQCIWINIKLVTNIKYINKNSTEIRFNNGYKYRINKSFRIIENQILRASRLESIILARKY